MADPFDPFDEERDDESGWQWLLRMSSSRNAFPREVLGEVQAMAAENGVDLGVLGQLHTLGAQDLFGMINYFQENPDAAFFGDLPDLLGGLNPFSGLGDSAVEFAQNLFGGLSADLFSGSRGDDPFPQEYEVATEEAPGDTEQPAEIDVSDFQGVELLDLSESAGLDLVADWLRPDVDDAETDMSAETETEIVPLASETDVSEGAQLADAGGSEISAEELGIGAQTELGENLLNQSGESAGSGEILEALAALLL